MRTDTKLLRKPATFRQHKVVSRNSRIREVENDAGGILECQQAVTGRSRQIEHDSRRIRPGPEANIFDDDGAEQVVVASAKNLCRIAVPPGIWHGWSSIEDNTVLISIASEPYMGYGRTGELDEERIPYNYFDGDEDGWSVKPR